MENINRIYKFSLSTYNGFQEKFYWESTVRNETRPCAFPCSHLSFFEITVKMLFAGFNSISIWLNDGDSGMTNIWLRPSQNNVFLGDCVALAHPKVGNLVWIKGYQGKNCNPTSVI